MPQGNKRLLEFAASSPAGPSKLPKPNTTLPAWMQQALQFQAPLHDMPIDVLKHLQTTLLCSNRIFREQGIARVIAGFHKDLLAQAVSDRINSHRDVLLEALSSPDVLTKGVRFDDLDDRAVNRAAELIHYMTYYVKNEEIYYKSMEGLDWLLLRAWSPRLKDLLIESGNELVLKGALLHSGRRTFGYFIKFFARLLKINTIGARVAYEDEDAIFDRFFDCRGADVLRMADVDFLRSVCVKYDDDDATYSYLFQAIVEYSLFLEMLLVSLSDRPQSRHHHLIATVQHSFGHVHMLSQQTPLNFEEDDEDDDDDDEEEEEEEEDSSSSESSTGEMVREVFPGFPGHEE
jgi:hypothetical protein